MGKRFVLFLFLILISGCIQSESRPINQIKVGKNVYIFSEDIRESLKIPIYNTSKVLEIINASEITLAFNGSSSEDNAYFTVIGYNIVFKLSKYRASQKRVVKLNVVDINNVTELSGPVLLFKGPNTGAKETSISAVNETIILQGTNYKNLTLAADRLSLLILGVENV